MSYRSLEVWQESRELVIEIHRMTLEQLPRFELYETGSQLRRSIKSVKANIVEGYGRRRSKSEYVRFLHFALASAIESIDHLETLYETGSLKDSAMYHTMHQKLIVLGKKLNKFIQAVERQHLPPKPI